MTLNTGSNYSLDKTIQVGVEAALERINTAIPGVVEMYDATTKRARVRPALQFRNRRGEHHPSVPLVDVPMLMSSAGGENGKTIVMPVVKDDFVLLLFSQRGIANFKRLWEPDVEPTRVGFFSLQDAVAMPIMGPKEITPAVDEAIVIQHDDGELYLAVQNEMVSVMAPATTVAIGVADAPEEVDPAVGDAISLQMKDKSTYFSVQDGKVSILSASTVAALGSPGDVITPAITGNAIVLQNEARSVYLAVGDTNIAIKTDDGDVDIGTSSGSVTINIGDANSAGDITLNRGGDHIELRRGSIGLRIDAAGTLPTMTFSMDQGSGLAIGVGNLPIAITSSDNITISTSAGNVNISGTTQVNTHRLARSGNTGSASGPGSHFHSLTAA